MKTCTFFGHRDSPHELRPIITTKIMELISKHGVNRFYVGTQGNFDFLVCNVLGEVSMIYPHIEYYIVLSKIPQKNTLPEWIDAEHTVVPDGIEKAPPRFAIEKCNRWMLNRSDYVLGYVVHSFGGAAKFMQEAERKGKTVINIAKIQV